MAKPDSIELPNGEKIPILYEDRSVLAIDKPRGWMLVPFSWQRTNRNLQAALTSSIAAGDFWARSRNLKYVRFVHRLDTETSGVLLLAKNPRALAAYNALFEGRKMEKDYLAVVEGLPKLTEWTSRLKLSPDPNRIGMMRAGAVAGKTAETRFRVLEPGQASALLHAQPFTGRTHQIRVHLAESGYPIVGDDLYGPKAGRQRSPLGLRAVGLAYFDPFTRRPIQIRASLEAFVKQFGFGDSEFWIRREWMSAEVARRNAKGRRLV